MSRTENLPLDRLDRLAGRRRDASRVTADGAAWLASAEPCPHGALALWRERPGAPVVLPCGTAFDVVSAPVVFGRGMLDRLREEGPGSGPVAGHRGRMLLFAAPGAAQRLPSLLEWEEWGARDRRSGAGRAGGVPPLLCHGAGDAVTVPAPVGGPGAERSGSRWLVAPDGRHPWLPGPEILLWAAVRAARAALRIPIFPPADQGAKVYDVSRRR
ncbi:bifunctional DNA primase/polymerase [Streptomyces sp. NPDC046985]|uniref:bifunctional DNA primase/polymerase n=1 Tax=Streptomyces sp. NPDC046985 TaxID=3155377 RepID=UPI0033D94B4D